MLEKIDGVNVSECNNYDSNQYWECDPFICHCEELPNCYFKQLKRAEQKLEKIKDIATDLLSLTNEYDNCYHKDKCSKCDKECQYRFVDKILQIIEGE